MNDSDIPDDQIRIELKRMLEAEKRRILAEYDRTESEFNANPDVPDDARQKLSAKLEEGREQLEVTLKAFSAFIDRR